MASADAIVSALENTKQRALVSAEQQVRYGPDGVKIVPNWQRLKAYWWLKKGQDAVDEAVTRGSGRTQSWPTFMRELHSRLYTGDTLNDTEAVKPEHQFGQKLHGLLGDLPEWERLARRCRGDAYSTGAAAAGLAGRMVEHVPGHKRDARKARRHRDVLQDQWDEAGGDEAGLPKPPELTELERELERAEAEARGHADAADPAAIRQSMREAIKSTSEQLDNLDRAAIALGWSSTEAGQGAESAGETKAAIASRLEKHEKLREIVALAGRMRNIMRESQATKVRHGVNEITDIETGSNIARLLPSELAMLRHPLTKLDLMRRLAEEGALQYRLEAKEKVGKGPIVVCVDDSGSMQGDREVWSKAVALALLELARLKDRKFAYCTFSSRITHEFQETPGQKTSPDAVLDHLLLHRGGGTNFNEPLNWAIDRVDEKGDLEEADVIFISDGECRCSETVATRIEASDARVWGVAIGGAATTDDGRLTMPGFCEKVWPVTDLNLARGDGQEDAAARGVLGV